MTRQILFRGFHKDESGKKTIYLNGEETKGNWVYGSLVYKRCFRDNGMIEIYYREWEEEYAYIYENNTENNIEEYPTKFIEVIPETVGQYIGLDDKNGKKIFENDVVEAFCKMKEKFVKGIVKFDMFSGLELETMNDDETWHFDYLNQTEVIRTIFDKEVK